MTLSRSDRELIEVVRSDLRHLQSQTSPAASDDQLRRTSVELRKLLIDDMLIKCWKALGRNKQPTIIAPKLDVDGLAPNAFAVAGGANIGSMQVANVTMSFGPNAAQNFTPELMRERSANILKALEWPFGLNEYKESCAIFVKGMKIKRSHVVSYIANKKGGAHFDPSRTRKKDIAIYALLDGAGDFGLSFGGSDERGGLNSVYLELLAMGQHITKSPDIEAMIKDCDAALS